MEPDFSSVKEACEPPPCRNAWAVPIARLVCARPLEFAIAFWLVAMLVIATAAKAETKLERRFGDLEKRMEDLEQNLAHQIASQPVCPAERAMELLDASKKPCEPINYGHSFEDCLAKQGRFNMTKAEAEARLYSIWECGYNQGIRKHNDP